jgi:hypothetical protein
VAVFHCLQVVCKSSEVGNITSFWKVSILFTVDINMKCIHMCGMIMFMFHVVLTASLVNL